MFLDRFEEKIVKQKSTIVLKARVIGNPVPEITWLKNNQLLHHTDRVALSYDGENIELIIYDADSEIDTGDYKCIASNTFGRASHGARVTVDVDEVHFTKPLKKMISIEEGQQLTLECETSHTASTTWWHDDKELTGMDHRQIIQNGRTHKLVIKNTNVRDIGKYRCKVKKEFTEATVEVLERSPEFVHRLEDAEVKEHGSIVLEVEITSESADVKWLKDGEEIKDATHKNIQLIKEGHIRKLILRSASIHDEGEYTCALADQECTADLNVIESPPQIVAPLKDTACIVGDTAVFEIELTKGDALVQWYKNNEEITFSDRVMLSIDGKKQRLFIKDTIITDTDTYSCRVGANTSSGQLTVEEPLVNFIVKLPEVTLVTNHTNVVLAVELSNPNVELHWYRKNELVKPSSKHEIFVEGTVRRLVITDATDKDIDEYSCVAQNVKSVTQLKVTGR